MRDLTNPDAGVRITAETTVSSHNAEDAYASAEDATRLLWEELDVEREAYDAEVQSLCDADQAT